MDEPYPTVCHNSGQLSDITQAHYMCRPISFKDKEMIRVTFETFVELSELPEQYKCVQRSVAKKVCVCPIGFGDYQCSTQLYRKCFINITEPAFHKGCSERPDTPEYLYTLPGFDPCFRLNFSQPNEIQFYLQCKVIDYFGLKEIVPHETTGYEYRDVIEHPKPYNAFNYVATNPQTEFGIMDAQKLILDFRLQDFRYLTNVAKTRIEISDPEILVGLKPETIELDLNSLL